MTRLTIGLGILLLVAVPSTAPAQTSHTCSYQGYLTDGGIAADGDYDFRFSLYDAESDGTLIAGPLLKDDLAVADGLFMAELDFMDSSFTGEDRWMEIEVRPGDSSGGYTALSPRQKMMSTPQALLAFRLRLPYNATVSSTTSAFAITQTGSRGAGVFSISQPTNNWTALMAESNGTGIALQASNTGTGSAAFFDIAQPVNASDVLQSMQMGLGRAGFFEIANIGNASPAIEATTAGTGEAGLFSINNPSSMSTALHVSTDGGGYALFAENLGSGNAAILANAINGPGAEIITQTGAAPALQATNMGNGVAVSASGQVAVSMGMSDVLDGLDVVHHGAARAAFLRITDSENNVPVIRSEHAGLGDGGYFVLTNPANASNALEARTYGGGYGLFVENLGPGNAAILANAQSGPGAEIVTQIAGAPAVQATNMGGGVAVLADGQLEVTGQIISNVAGGTAPLSVDSGTMVANLHAERVGGLYAGRFNCNANFAELVDCGGVVLLQNGAHDLFRIESQVGDASAVYSYYLDGVLVSKAKLSSGAHYDFDISPAGGMHHAEVILARPWAGGVVARVDLFYENGRAGGSWYSPDKVN